jgi:hypothetical protein
MLIFTRRVRRLRGAARHGPQQLSMTQVPLVRLSATLGNERPFEGTDLYHRRFQRARIAATRLNAEHVIASEIQIQIENLCE